MRRNAVIEQLELAFFKSPAILNQLDANGDLNLTREEFVENMRRIQARPRLAEAPWSRSRRKMVSRW